MARWKTLVVEDDRSLAEVLAYNLTQAGYEVMAILEVAICMVILRRMMGRPNGTVAPRREISTDSIVCTAFRE